MVIFFDLPYSQLNVKNIYPYILDLIMIEDQKRKQQQSLLK